MTLPPDPFIGTNIAGRYTVKAQIGTGGMGTVYLATQQPLGRQVALKVLKESLAHDDVSVRRFYKEAQAVAQLNHPNIVTIYDFGTGDNGILFLAMELLQGKELLDVMSQKRHLTWEESLPIILGTCRALAAAHSERIVHRDLKPDNVMLIDSDLGEPMVKVLDFGLAKMVQSEPSPDQNRLTSADVIMGTPGYMSPEQINGQEIDVRTDLYSLGVLWWEMLVGRPLFVEDAPIKILVRHIQDEPTPPSLARPSLQLPSEGEALILRLLSKTPDSRPRDGEHALSLVQGLMGENWTISPLARVSMEEQPHDQALEDIVDEWAANFTDRLSQPNRLTSKHTTPNKAVDDSHRSQKTIISTPVSEVDSLTQETDIDGVEKAAPILHYTPDPWLVREGGSDNKDPGQVRLLERSSAPDSPALPQTPGPQNIVRAENIDLDSVLFELKTSTSSTPGSESTPPKYSAKSDADINVVRSPSVNPAEAKTERAQKGDVPPIIKDAPNDKASLPDDGDGGQEIHEQKSEGIPAPDASQQEPPLSQPEGKEEFSEDKDSAHRDESESHKQKMVQDGPEPVEPFTPAAQKDSRQENSVLPDVTESSAVPSSLDETADPPRPSDLPVAPEDSENIEEIAGSEAMRPEKAPAPIPPQETSNNESQDTKEFQTKSPDPNSDFAQLFLKPEVSDESSEEKDSGFWGDAGPPDGESTSEYWADLEESDAPARKKKRRKKKSMDFGSSAVILGFIFVSLGSALYMLDPVFLQPYRDKLAESYEDTVESLALLWDELVSGPPPPPLENPLLQVREAWIAELGLPKVSPDQLDSLCRDRFSQAKTLAKNPNPKTYLQMHRLYREALLANPEFLPAAAGLLENLASFDQGESMLQDLPWRKMLRYGLSKPAGRNDFIRAKAALLLQRGKADKALEILSEKPDLLQDKKALTLQLHALNDTNPKLARQEFDAYKNVLPSTLLLQREHGILHRLEGNWPKAESMLKARLRKTPADSRTIQQLSLLDMDRNQARRALARLTKHLKRFPWDNRSRFLASKISTHFLNTPDRALAIANETPASSHQSKDTTWQLELQKAALHSQLGNFKEALHGMQALAKDNHQGKDPRLHFLWGQQLLRQGKPMKALRAFERAQDFESEPSRSTWLHTHIGESNLEAKDLKTAQQAFSWATDINKGFLPAHLGRLLAHLTQKKEAEAAQALDGILQGDPVAGDDIMDPEAPLALNDSVIRMRARLTKLKSTEENHFIREFGLGMAAFHLKESDAARRSLERVLELKSGHLAARFLLAALDIRTGNLQSGLNRIDALQSDGARSQGLWALRARAELGLNMFDQAQRSLTKINNPALHATLLEQVLGEIADRNGDREEARKRFTASLHAEPRNQQIKDRLKRFHKP